jgi:threonine synthase
VGNTPLLAIDFSFRGRKRVLYAKAENINMTGIIKDRMALYILQQGYATGTLRPGDLIAEATSGNTGISIAAIGRAMGHPVSIFMPDWMSAERIKKGFASTDVRLLGFSAFKRVCHTCCDPVECVESFPDDFIAAEQALPDCPRRTGTIVP